MATIVFVPGGWIAPEFYKPYLDADSDAVAKVIRPLVEDEGREFLLVMHSYAGMAGAAAATGGLATIVRVKQGKTCGVVGMVFIAAFLVPEGLSCATLQGGNLPAWTLLDRLLQDLPANVKPHSTLAFNSPQPTPAWAEEGYNGRLGFIVTLQDKAVSKEAQHLMISATQKDWIVKEMDCSHCAPFLNRIDDCIGLVQGLLREFQSKTT
ncbi:hypothetical protein BDV39DRAFT_215728 [Aspergillus sergii]|uniref:AB hydrolase-1 domain-containing protein n=1 Tax=Aspergillus sergii TaxID=1034303 RepID=A0A5N6XHD7_9EURO|nr:hypothetical protein BDV39DRAFT_215728 [Aspergillus sergii]